MKLLSIDLFSGIGGLTEGMRKAGFRTKLAVELDELAAKTYKLNHPKTKILTQDIRSVDVDDLKFEFENDPIHLLAGCPPCQGFSSIRTLNKPKPVEDERNSLIKDFVRFVLALRPYTFMMENVPGLVKYDLFHWALEEFHKAGYFNPQYKIVNVKDYGVPQNRNRLVLVGSRLGTLNVASPKVKTQTVRQVIGSIEKPEFSDDPAHKLFPTHTPEILAKIMLTPKDGGSRKDLPEAFQLDCHKKENVGFNDVYGRLKWDSFSSTITGGCLNPSKGRFLHPEEDRCISAREASLLQSFPTNYVFPSEAPKAKIALMIGNALPPKLSYYQSKNIKNHLMEYLG